MPQQAVSNENVGDGKMKKFGIDNPFFDFMGRVGDILILNILFVITCIPVVTIGTSLCAMYRVTLRMARKESNYVAREYFHAWRGVEEEYRNLADPAGGGMSAHL